MDLNQNYMKNCVYTARLLLFTYIVSDFGINISELFIVKYMHLNRLFIRNDLDVSFLLRIEN